MKRALLHIFPWILLRLYTNSCCFLQFKISTGEGSGDAERGRWSWLDPKVVNMIRQMTLNNWISTKGLTESQSWWATVPMWIGLMRCDGNWKTNLRDKNLQDIRRIYRPRVKGVWKTRVSARNKQPNTWQNCAVTSGFKLRKNYVTCFGIIL